MKIESYTKGGKQLYRFQAYLGKDPLTGKSTRTTRSGFTSKKAAELEYARLRNGIGDHKATPYTFRHIYDMWIRKYANTVQRSTLYKTEQLFTNHILPEFGDMLIDRINMSHVQLAIDSWSSKFVKYHAMKGYLSHIFKHAQRMKAIEHNPCDLIIMPTKRSIKGVEKEEFDNFWERKEADRFLSYCKEDLGNMWHAFFRLLLYAGLRRGEAMALVWDDINFNDNQVDICKSLAQDKTGAYLGPPKNDASYRVLDLDNGTIEILKEWMTLQTFQVKQIVKDQLVFANSNNEYVTFSQPRKQIMKICKAHGIEYITPHGFRHTHCSILFESGASIKEVQDRLGHSDITTTMNIYAHVSKTKKKDVASRFAEYMDDASSSNQENGRKFGSKQIENLVK